ncbi:MAG: TolC family protein [Candidatus Adiutrix sp.]|nr:TolC family protein [Candidatus Adiutrix sp.]
MAVAAILVALTGCAEAARHKISRPPLAPSPDPQTVFGRATLTGAGDPAAPPAGPPIPDRPLTLEECLAIAKEVNPNLDSADQARMGALWNRWQSITAFLPTGSTSYRVNENRNRAPGSNPLSYSGRNPQYTWGVGVSQPLFAGGRNFAGLMLAQLGVASAEVGRVQAREDLNLEVKRVYFGILALEKALEVARTSVVNLRSHLNVAHNFYEVGMAPKNQVLEAEVALARAVQQANDRDRDLMVNKARLNILLRRPVDAPVAVADALGRNAFPLSLHECLDISLADRPELKLGRNQVEASARNVDTARSGLYPKVDLTYTTTTGGSTPRANNDGTDWSVAAVANIDFWEWGRTKAQIEQSKVDLNRSVNALTSLEDETKLEVTSNFQSLSSAGLNIEVMAKAVESAAEDLRMVKERYLEQVATNTEVLDAQTRYSQAQYDYYTALYNYNLAWATLERWLGRPVPPSPPSF